MVADDVHSQLEQARKAAMPEASMLATYRDYYAGRQRSTLTVEQQRLLMGVTGHRFADNVCRTIITTAADRLELARFEVADRTVQDYLHELWVTTHLATLAAAVHVATPRDGNHAVGLAWDADRGRVRLYRERWWDGTRGVWIAYDDDGDPAYAAKEWKASEGLRRVIWRPHQIERYIADGNGWQWYALPGEPTGPVPWLKRDGGPLGIPLVHFPNGSTDDTPYGASDLAGGALALQDEINDLQRDLTSGARLTAYQMLYGTGVTLAKDAAGNSIPLKVMPGTALTSDKADARFGTLPAGDMSQLISVYLTKLKAVSRMTDTPLHLITGGEWPSGEALLRAEMPLVGKVRRQAESIGPAWATVAHRATELANTFGGAGLDEDAMITAVFAPPDKRDPLTQAAIAVQRAPFVSDEETLRTLGYDPEAVVAILRERARGQRIDPERRKLLHELALIAHQLGASKQTLLRELGYDPVAEARQREREASAGQELGNALMRQFGRGQDGLPEDEDREA